MPHIARVRGFSGERDYDLFSVVRVNNTLLKELGGRYTWVAISGNMNVIFRRATGAVPGIGLPIDAIELGYDSRSDLGISGERDEQNFYPCDLSISPAGALDRFRAHWSNPNVNYQVPFQLGMIGLALGAIGLLLGIISLTK